jgi:hypothetical protein
LALEQALEDFSMAKIILGSTVAQVSGSISGTVYSHNRYGAYIRNRSKPIVATSEKAMNQKGIFGAMSRLWSGLTEAQKTAWKTYADNHPVTDSLGVSQTLSSQAWFQKCNVALSAWGFSPILDPPSAAAPSTSPLVTPTYTATPEALKVTPTGTLSASEALVLYVAKKASAGVTYVQNQLKSIGVSSLHLATAWTITTEYETTIGTITLGDNIVFEARVLDSTTGLYGPVARVDWTVVATT